MKREVDMAYLLKTKEYGKYFLKLMEIIAAKFVFLLSKRTRDRIGSYWSKIQQQKSGRMVKRSKEDVEKFADLQMALLKEGKLE